MMRLVVYTLTFSFLVACSGGDKKREYHPQAIELNDQAVELMQRHEYDSAVMLLDQAIALDANYELPHSNKLGIYIRNQRWDKALEESEQYVQKKPDAAEGCTMAGMLHESLGDTATAKQYYTKSIALFDERINNPEKKDQIRENKLNRAFSFLLLGQEAKAKEEMEKLKAAFPDDQIIEEFLRMNKEDFMKQMLGRE